MVAVSEGTVLFRGYRTWYQVLGDQISLVTQHDVPVLMVRR